MTKNTKMKLIFTSLEIATISIAVMMAGYYMLGYIDPSKVIPL